MSKLFAINDDNDIFTEANGQLATVTGIEAVVQNVEQALKAQFGEMIYAKGRGVDYMGTIFGGSVNVVGFESSCRAAILETPDVVSIVSFEIFRDGEIAKFSTVIETPYGEEAISNAL